MAKKPKNPEPLKLSDIPADQMTPAIRAQVAAAQAQIAAAASISESAEEIAQATEEALKPEKTKTLKQSARETNIQTFEKVFPSLTKLLDSVAQSKEERDKKNQADERAAEQAKLAMEELTDKQDDANLELKNITTQIKSTNKSLGDITKVLVEIKTAIQQLGNNGSGLSPLDFLDEGKGARRGLGKSVAKGGARGAARGAVRELGGGSLLRGVGKIGGGALLGGGLEAYDEYQQSGNVGRAASAGVGGTAGGALGAWGGAAAGAALGSVVPIVGTAIGGTIGAILGGMGGSMLGGSAGKGVYDYATKPSTPGQSNAIASLEEKQKAAEKEKDLNDLTFTAKSVTFKADTISFNSTNMSTGQQQQTGAQQQASTTTPSVPSGGATQAVAPQGGTGAAPTGSGAGGGTGAAGGEAGAGGVDQVLATIRKRESGGNYNARAKGSSASGAYQFIDSTWQSLTRKYKIGGEYKSAGSAPAQIQDQVARAYVSDILKQNGGDVSKVPLVWYTGNAQGQMSAKALAANGGMTAQAYQSKWMNDFSKTGGGGVTASTGALGPGDNRAAARRMEMGSGQVGAGAGGAPTNLGAESGRMSIGGMDGVSPALAEALSAAASEYFQATGKKIQVTSGRRDSQKQAKLYQDYISGKSPYPAAKPGTSKHERGLAADINRADADAMDKMGILARHGLHRPVRGDPVHIEYMGGGPSGEQIAEAMPKPQITSSSTLTPKESSTLSTAMGPRGNLSDASAALQPNKPTKGTQLSTASTNDQVSQRSSSTALQQSQSTPKTAAPKGKDVEGKFDSSNAGHVEPIDASKRFKDLYELGE